LIGGVIVGLMHLRPKKPVPAEAAACPEEIV
jgi:hypothetical protein